MHYKQINYNERLCIANFYESGRFSISEIARQIGRSKSSVWQEIKRNARKDGTYLASDAEEYSRLRKLFNRKEYKKENPVILNAIKNGLTKKWSPKIIAVELTKEYPHKPNNHVSHQTIYEIIKDDKRSGGIWFKSLPQGVRKRRKTYGKGEKRGVIKNRVGIGKRPAEVENKKRLGDWEGDTIVGGKDKGGLLSFVERKSQYVVLDLLKDCKSASLNKAAQRSFKRHGKLPCKTLTLDNGKEFAGHEVLSRKLKVDVYFARPYHSWERGLNEQVNGMVRWWFPKGTDFRKVTRAEVKRVEKLLNERPRERLGYRTPTEVLKSPIVRLQT